MSVYRIPSLTLALDARSAFQPEGSEPEGTGLPFGPLPYGPTAGFASVSGRCAGCREVLPSGHGPSNPCPECGELPHDETHARLAELEADRAGGSP